MPSEKPKCQALKKNGKPCGAAPTKTGLCFFHSNPNLVAELGRVGGRRSHRSQTESLIASRLESPASATHRLESLYQEVKSGAVRPQVASVLIKLTDLNVRILEKTYIEDEIAQLREQILMLKSLIETRDEELLLRNMESQGASQCEEDSPSSEP